MRAGDTAQRERESVHQDIDVDEITLVHFVSFRVRSPALVLRRNHQGVVNRIQPLEDAG